MQSRISTSKAIEFRSKLGFNHFDITLKEEQEIIIRILKSFPGIKMIQQYFVLNNKYKIDLYLPDYRVAIEIDKKGHIDKERRQKYIKEELDCKFKRINSDSENSDMDATIGTISITLMKQIKNQPQNQLKNL